MKLNIDAKTVGLMFLILVFTRAASQSQSASMRETARYGDVGQNAAAKRAVSITQYEVIYRKIWQAVQKGFHDPKMNGVDWTKIGSTYHARLAAVRSRSEFETLMNQMLAELHASHMGYVTTDDAEYYMLRSVSTQDLQHDEVEHIGIMGRQEGKDYTVCGVLEGYPAQQAGILAGDRLELADDKPFSTAGSFRGKEGTAVQLQFRRGGEEKPRRVMVKPVKSNMLHAFLEATRRSAKIIEVGGKKIGYLHLWTMAEDSFRVVMENQVLTKLHETDGLLLDLRDGYGGHPFGFSDVFFRPDVSWESEYRNLKPMVQHTGYNKPMVVLINGGTRSAKEFFAYQLKTTKRATLVGTRTAGAFLGANFMQIGEDGLLEMAAVGLKVDGKVLEDKGVSPDMEVAPSDLYTDKDSQLSQAKKTLLDQLAQAPSPAVKPEMTHAN